MYRHLQPGPWKLLLPVSSLLNHTIATWKQRLGPLLSRVAARQLQDFPGFAAGAIATERKADGSLITACDRWSDRTLVEALRQAIPGAGVLSEEGNTCMPAQEWVWVLDPLDGTTNFSAGIPHWTISLALLHHRQPVLGWLESPATGQRLIAVRDEGVELNGRRLAAPEGMLSPSACASLCTRSMVVLQRRAADTFPCKLRMFGVASTNMSSVALGQTLAALECSPKIWDLAAAWLVLDELRCPIECLDGSPFPAEPGAELGATSYPLLTVGRPELLPHFRPWAAALRI